MGRYKGSALGIAWAALLPVLLVIVYTFFLGVILRSKWNQEEVGQTYFALMVFCGLLVFNVFSETVTRSPSLVTSHANFVTKVVFPLEILPVVSLFAALFHFLIGFVVLLLCLLAFGYELKWTVLLLPTALVPLSLTALGLSWALAALGVYLRDLNSLIAPATTALFFLSPVFYPSNAVPEQFRYLMVWNPLTPVIEQVRFMVMSSRPPELSVAVGGLASSVFLAVCGLVLFRRLKRGFADVL